MNTDVNNISGLSNGFLTHFKSPMRPDYGTEGRLITLKVNHFQVSVPKGFIHHYDINIHPDKCPRRVNRLDMTVGLHAKIICASCRLAVQTHDQ
jgi:hypothetical protein